MSRPPKVILYERLWKCAVCDQPLIYNATAKTLECGCPKILKDYEIDKETLRLHFRRTFNLDTV